MTYSVTDSRGILFDIVVDFKNIFADFEPMKQGNCAIIIQTGGAKYANTFADCRLEIPFHFTMEIRSNFLNSILLSGSKGVYAFPLHKSLTNRIPFQNHYRDIFLVEVDEQLKQIEYVVLEHNNENSAPAWFVDFVVVKLLNYQQEYLYVAFYEYCKLKR